MIDRLAAESQLEITTMQEAVAHQYDLPDLIAEVDACEEGPKLIIGAATPDTLERVTDRHYSIVRSDSHYSMSLDDLAELEEDIAYMLPAEREAATIARRLFIGLGVAAVSIHELWSKHEVAAFKIRSHREAVKDFFASKDEIINTLMTLFPNSMKERALNMGKDLVTNRP